MRKLGKSAQAGAWVEENVKLDPFDFVSCNEKILLAAGMEGGNPAQDQLVMRGQLNCKMRDFQENYLNFWSVGTFAGQEGGMGQLIDDSHPVFDRFPTEFHTNWQWWPMASQRAVILPKRCQTIVAEMDSYAFLRPMTQLMECKCGNGRLMFSSMGLQNLQQYPEARALLDSIYHYMDSDKFKPNQRMEMEVLKSLLKN